MGPIPGPSVLLLIAAIVSQAASPAAAQVSLAEAEETLIPVGEKPW